MYYEEKLIDGILHWRGMPDGGWRPIPLEKLGERVVTAEAFRAAVAAALAALCAEMASMVVSLPAEFWIKRLDATITKLGLTAEAVKEKQ